MLAAAGVVQRDDVRVRQPRRGLGLAEEPLLLQRRPFAGAHRLERHRAPELAIARLVHDAEAAAPDLAHELEASHHRAGTQHVLPGGPELDLRRPRQLAEERRHAAGRSRGPASLVVIRSEATAIARHASSGQFPIQLPGAGGGRRCPCGDDPEDRLGAALFPRSSGPPDCGDRRTPALKRATADRCRSRADGDGPPAATTAGWRARRRPTPQGTCARASVPR